jgi:hypothetical protein
MKRHLIALVVLPLFANCADPTRLEAAWYLQDGEADKPSSSGGQPRLLIAVRNRAEHSEAIRGFTVDPVNAPNGWRGVLELKKPVVLAPGQLLILDTRDLQRDGDPWVQRFPWRKPVPEGPPEADICAAPLRLKVRLADGRSHGVPMADGMPSFLGAPWLEHCVVAVPATSASAPTTSPASEVTTFVP